MRDMLSSRSTEFAWWKARRPLRLEIVPNYGLFGFSASLLRSVNTQVEISDLPVKSEPIIEDTEATQAQCE